MNGFELGRNGLEPSRNGLDLSWNSLELSRNSLELSWNGLELSWNSLELDRNSLELSRNNLELRRNSLVSSEFKTEVPRRRIAKAHSRVVGTGCTNEGDYGMKALPRNYLHHHTTASRRGS